MDNALTFAWLNRPPRLAHRDFEPSTGLDYRIAINRHERKVGRLARRPCFAQRRDKRAPKRPKTRRNETSELKFPEKITRSGVARTKREVLRNRLGPWEFIQLPLQSPLGKSVQISGALIIRVSPRKGMSRVNRPRTRRRFA